MWIEYDLALEYDNKYHAIRCDVEYGGDICEMGQNEIEVLDAKYYYISESGKERKIDYCKMGVKFQKELDMQLAYLEPIELHKYRN